VKPWPLGPGEPPRLTLKAAVSVLRKAGFKFTAKNAATYHDLKASFDARKLRESSKRE
jgi:hypothetical protein